MPTAPRMSASRAKPEDICLHGVLLPFRTSRRKSRWRAPAAALSNGKQKRESSSHLPGRSAGRTYGVVITGNLSVHRLITCFENSTEATTDRYGPLLTRLREPIRGDDR